MSKESDGERAIRAALDNLNIIYEQEKEIFGLKKDSKKYRIADFYLPDYQIFIEYLGGWDKKDSEERQSERNRYLHKKHVYEDNGIKCIWIYPKQLNYVSFIIEKRIEELERTEELAEIEQENNIQEVKESKESEINVNSNDIAIHLSLIIIISSLILFHQYWLWIILASILIAVVLYEINEIKHYRKSKTK